MSKLSRALRRRGYYLVNFDTKPPLRKGTVTELWHQSGLRLRRLHVWAEQENFKGRAKLENFYPAFTPENFSGKNGYNILFRFKSARYLGRSLVVRLDARARRA
jgi:hypothetical protein